MRGIATFAAFLIVPALAIAFGYGIWLGHRTDYVGHFLAGAGGALALLSIAAFSIRLSSGIALGWPVVGICLLAIALGAVTEATIFRNAKFDEVDFANQSLGAVLAGLGVLAIDLRERWNLGLTALGLAASVVLLATGWHYAFL